MKCPWDSASPALCLFCQILNDPASAFPADEKSHKKVTQIILVFLRTCAIVSRSAGTVQAIYTPSLGLVLCELRRKRKEFASCWA